MKILDIKKTEKEVKSNQIEWLFKPPRSPWMSGTLKGKCELKTIIKERRFADDALYTVMTEVRVNCQ